MPRWWYDRHAIGEDLTDEQRHLYRAIVADRKPYFMRYIYPTLSKQYSTYCKAADKNAMRLYGMSIRELTELPVSSLSDEQLEFIRKYKRHMPVGTGKCVMNTICRKLETIFGEYLPQLRNDNEFDYTVLKTGSDYSAKHLAAVKVLMNEYDRRLREHSVDANSSRVPDDEKRSAIAMLDDYFKEECTKICPDKDELCNIVIDLCYEREKTKQFAWHMCGDLIIDNLERKHGSISFPEKNDEGDIIWKTRRFSTKTIRLDVVE